MLVKTITYTNPFTNEEVTEEHYFNITKADLIEMQADQEGSMEDKLQKIANADGESREDKKLILSEFKSILKRAYGKRVGDRHIKTDETWNEFASSEAYSALVFELFTDAAAAAEFMNNIIPAGLEAEVEKIVAKRAEQNDSTEVADPTGLTNPTTPRVLTSAEVAEMDSAELQAGLADGRYKLS